MIEITPQQAAEVISDGHRTSPYIVKDVHEEAVEGYVEVGPSSIDDNVLNYGEPKQPSVRFDYDGREGAGSAIAGLHLRQMSASEFFLNDDITQEEMEADLGANWAVAYAMDVTNQTLRATNGNEEAVSTALDSAQYLMKQALDPSTEVYIGKNNDLECGMWPNNILDVEETIEDFQEEVEEMLSLDS